MQKNDLLTVTACALGTGGEGIAHYEGGTIFVPYLLPGERATVRVLKEKNGIAYGKVEELITPAEERVRPVCPVFRRCGGCQLQHIRYRDQLKFKTSLVKEALYKIAGIEAEVSNCERSEKDYGYRNKLQLPVGKKGEENVVGFFAERTHRIVPIPDCPIHPAWTKPLIEALLSFMGTCGLDGYDPETGKGQIRHIVVRELKRKYLVTLVCTVHELKGIDYFTFLLDKIFPEYSLYLNFNDRRDNVVLGSDFTLIKGKGQYECTDAGISYEVGANTFIQVNDDVRSKLYESLVSRIDGGVVVDCYSGGGLLTAMLAKKCERAYGIEVVPEASACAKKLAEVNGLSEKMIPICGKVEEELPAILEREPNAAVVLDPPRTGVDRAVLSLLSAHGVKKIFMISCNPSTLARDLGILTGALKEQNGALVKAEGGDYGLLSVQPFDMFPQTKHVETLVVLERRK